MIDAEDEVSGGVFDVADKIGGALEAFIEASYHIRDEGIIDERHELLRRIGTIRQEAFVEATPTYATDRRLGDLEIPALAKQVLAELSLQADTGIYDPPYRHQSEALESFFGAGEDLIVATGTGSGKTEAFLMPLAASLALEVERNASCAMMTGCRAILLYPMNALVSDQLGRIRKLFGSPACSAIVSRNRSRPVTFASYTSRTPYPGLRKPQRDQSRVAPLFDEFYSKVELQPKLLKQLRDKGRWPEKNLTAFYAKHLEEQAVYQSGRKRGRFYIRRNWDRRLKTSADDRELLLRHEVTTACPDILITNYSMLEYMLLRPIEGSVFAQTKAWLDADEENKLLLVLDEAHMYRGAAGAEVALLLRRLLARLGIGRERLRCILTSASLGEGKEAERDVITFADDLTGSDGSRSFRLVVGTLESRSGARAATPAETTALGSFDLAAFHKIATEPQPAASAVGKLAMNLEWPAPGPEAQGPDASLQSQGLAAYLYGQLEGFGPAEALIAKLGSRTSALSRLSEGIVPIGTDAPLADNAVASLLALSAFARRREGGRVLLPTRLHLFHRGLPALYACCSADCDRRRSSLPAPIGRLYAAPRIACECSRNARVYELLTHRDCGAAFIRGYMTSADGDFLWNEPGSRGPDFADERLSDAIEGTVDLLAVEFLVDGEPHPKQKARERWLDVRTGRLRDALPSDSAGFRRVWQSEHSGRDGVQFKLCPVCAKPVKTKEFRRSKIEHHGTSGENPFTTLIAAQLAAQPAQVPESNETPNGGRKVLLFSDGRQKAARLARDMPLVIELDVFRQALCLAIRKLEAEWSPEAEPDRQLYIAFLLVAQEHNLAMFSGASNVAIAEHIKQVQTAIEDDGLRHAFTLGLTPPEGYQLALLKQLCGRLYSLADTTVGFIKPRRAQLNRLLDSWRALRPEFERDTCSALATAWIGNALELHAFGDGQQFPQALRDRAARHPGAGEFDGRFRRSLRDQLVGGRFNWGEACVARIEDDLRMHLATADKDPNGTPTGKFFILGARVALTVDLEASWYQCPVCRALEPVTLSGACINCGEAAPTELEPSSAYLRSRKGFFRDPVASVMEGTSRLAMISVAEHTAQLSNRDNGAAYSTTERYELAFQDILLDPDRDRPIDILSCTTTMEVGIDIGKLIAVGLRNVPPERSNYQQRAGRAGRKGAGVSSVVSYADRGPHDSYYFANPEKIIQGPPRTPEIKIDNAKIARRHVHSYLIQTFFHERLEAGYAISGIDPSLLQTSLGRTDAFLHGAAEEPLSLAAFRLWIEAHVLVETPSDDLRNAQAIAAWLPPTLKIDRPTLTAWVRDVALDFVARLDERKTEFPVRVTPAGDAAYVDENDEAQEATHVPGVIASSEEEKPEERIRGALRSAPTLLLDFLFAENLLPTYAFPTDLASFLVERDEIRGGMRQVHVVEMPQQDRLIAISEYAPGRQIVIDKKTYRSGAVVASVTASEQDRAAPLFAALRPIISCDLCGYVQVRAAGSRAEDVKSAPLPCPVCERPLRAADMIEPEVYLPAGRKPLEAEDNEQRYTYASAAKFPLPVGEDALDLRRVAAHVDAAYATEQELVAVNRGAERGAQPFGGFFVCAKCGAASLDGKLSRTHERNYFVAGNLNDSSYRCDGTGRWVLLGHRFKTDVLLVRFRVASPIINQVDRHRVRDLQVLGDALTTVAEALQLAASRHPQLDIDHQEFGSGSRIIPFGCNEQFLDVYLYDALSGGAGYSEIAGRHIEDILVQTLALLEGCPARCERSCTECLRHYRNQSVQPRLDRTLGAQLLRYALYDEVPRVPFGAEQSRRLRQLQRLLELDGYTCTPPRGNDRFEPLRAEKPHAAPIVVAVYPGLLEQAAAKQSIGSAGNGVELLSTYELDRQLPETHEKLRRASASGLASRR